MDIDALLWRPVHDGKQFEKLMPKSNCKEVFTGDGMTDYSVEQMAEMVKLAHWQTAKIAPLLKQRSLQGTCKAIHAFCYNHFQYKADLALQVLRSPACSWSVRHGGIDCKSYSIIASCILTNLGITHYIRRIKQPAFEPTMWTHVYVVVPVDQKTGSLAGGYHTIDGTIATMNEPMFLQKNDLKMKHVGLMGTVPQRRAQHQQGLGVSFSSIKDTVSSIFSSGWAPSCIGGTHTGKDFEKTRDSVIQWFYNAVNNVNSAIQNNSPQVMTLANEILMTAQQIRSHSNSYANHDWDSKCSRDATKAYKNLGIYYENIALKAFLPWLQNSFNITMHDVSGVKRGGYTNAIKSEFTKTSFNGGSITVKQIQSLSLKPSTTSINAFEFTPYVTDKKNQANFNVTEFLGTLNNTLATFGVGNNNTPGTGSNIGKGGTYENIPSQPIQQAGFGVMGFLLLAGATGMVFAGMKDKGAGPKAVTTKKATK